MITGSEIRDLVLRKSPVIDGMKGMVQAICDAGSCGEMGEDEFVEMMRSILFDQISSTSGDDKYWTAKSPFDGLWYTFASWTSTDWPTDPVCVTPVKPLQFGDD
ncbi:MAG: hypothetical protein ABH884_00555, partial [Candidatus Komeilibacteria bacterium]